MTMTEHTPEVDTAYAPEAESIGVEGEGGAEHKPKKAESEKKRKKRLEKKKQADDDFLME